MMPVFPGAPWLPKFKGPDSDIKYSEWREQIEGLLGTQELTEVKRVAIVLGALAGEAKRQVGVLDVVEKDKVEKIFSFLDTLYGHKTPTPVLRSQFFSCTQKAGENVSSFILRLREFYGRLRRRDPDAAPSDAVLREQFLLGLCDSPFGQAIRVYARRHPDEDFAAIRQEALLLDSEHGGMTSPEVSCHAVNRTPVSQPLQEVDRNATLKREIMDDVKAQMQGLTQEIMKELRPLLQPALTHTPSPPPPHDRQGRRHTSNYGNDWDERGRPICRQCRRPGHIARFCRAASQSPTTQPPTNQSPLN